MNNKFYILATACSGKSTAINQKGTDYKLDLIDQDDLTTRWITDGKLLPRWPERKKADLLLSHLENLSFPTCLLASMIPNSPESYSDITFVSVIVPKPLHKYFLVKRYIKLFLSCFIQNKKIFRCLSPDGAWYRWKDIKDHRQRIIDYSKDKNIPAFSSIDSALQWVAINTGNHRLDA